MVAVMSKRLTMADWIEHGLKTLARRGPDALKVVPLSAALNVSRGSFYWHFRDIADFRSRLLDAWRERATDRVIAEIEARRGAPDRLESLLLRAFVPGRGLERAVRAWAGHDRDAAAAVAAVDETRLGYITRLLLEAGVARDKAAARATFLYWAYLGQTVASKPAGATLGAAALRDVAALFES